MFAEFRALRPGSQVLALKNEHDRELVARIERTAARDDALTAGRAATLSLFRELFPTFKISTQEQAICGICAATN